MTLVGESDASGGGFLGRLVGRQEILVRLDADANQRSTQLLRQVKMRRDVS